ncbi:MULTISPECIES: hypothetical protein [unclassified Pseudomonas]|uniref:hypothetical protein n=1 Tax=unclassified Pseudomonas TaxID=196821 RepID=UPI0011AEE482|nr:MULTISPECIES: hypothetical protein [unclassified Pseudomonas]
MIAVIHSRRRFPKARTLFLGCLVSPLALAENTPLILDQQIVAAPSVESTTVAADVYRYLDGARQHRLSLLVENLFDRDYVTSRASNVDNLGRPFTSELRYTYTF